VKREGEIILNPESRLPPSSSNISHRKHSARFSQHSANANGDFMILREDEIIVNIFVFVYIFVFRYISCVLFTVEN
jgi:hypothetical protein